MTELCWEPGQPKHKFEGLYGTGSDGYRYHVVLERNSIRVSEISTHGDLEVLTRYVRLDRDLGSAKRYAQQMENEDKPNTAHIVEGMDEKFGILPQQTDFRTMRH